MGRSKSSQKNASKKNSSSAQAANKDVSSQARSADTQAPPASGSRFRFLAALGLFTVWVGYLIYLVVRY